MSSVLYQSDQVMSIVPTAILFYNLKVLNITQRISYTAAYINKGSHSSDSDHSFSDLEDDPRPPEDKIHPQVEGGVIQSASPTKQKPPNSITDLASGDTEMAEMLMRHLLPLFVNTFSTTSSTAIRQVYNKYMGCFVLIVA